LQINDLPEFDVERAMGIENDEQAILASLVTVFQFAFYTACGTLSLFAHGHYSNRSPRNSFK